LEALSKRCEEVLAKHLATPHEMRVMPDSAVKPGMLRKLAVAEKAQKETREH
jgi:hypothetical protein